MPGYGKPKAQFKWAQRRTEWHCGLSVHAGSIWKSLGPLTRLCLIDDVDVWTQIEEKSQQSDGSLGIETKLDGVAESE